VTQASGETTTTSVQPGEEFDVVLELVRQEMILSAVKYGGYASVHEGHAVIREETEEMWDEIKAKNTTRAIEEAIQAAASAARFVYDFGILGKTATAAGSELDALRAMRKRAEGFVKINEPVTKRLAMIILGLED
jgi:hypothetical protein